jgi:hypothetical protein
VIANLPPVPTVPGLDPADYEICACCCHIEKRGEHAEPHSMGVVNAPCPNSRGWRRINLNEWADRENWRQLVAVATARHATCPKCGEQVRVMRKGTLILHKRKVRPSDGRKRKPVDCEGSRLLVLEPLPVEAA